MTTDSSAQTAVPADPVPADPVPADLVDAAVRAADHLDKDIADVSILAIAREAGISRSTLIRRLGGTRGALDDAVRAAGIDPGGQRPVRDRAVEAGAALIGEHGLAALTLEAVSAEARCSVPSLYAVFASRDGLLLAIYARHWPIVDIEAYLASTDDDLDQTVRTIVRLLAENFHRQPRVLPAVLAEVLARPNDPTVRALLGQYLPRLISGVGQWLADEISKGRVRDLPITLMLQQLVGPILLHSLSRSVDESLWIADLPDADQSYDILADYFLRAVRTPDATPDRSNSFRSNS